MSEKFKQDVMQARTRHRAAILGVFVLAMSFGVAWMTGACGSSVPGASASTSSGGTSGPAAECPASNEVPCMRYHIPLDGNPSMDVTLRNKYIAAFGSACYMSEFGTFDCFYQKWQDACADAVKIAEVSGNAPFDKGYMCQPVGNGDYTLQVGSDVANFITINYQNAPRQTPLVEVDGMPAEVSSPYRSLTDPAQVGPGDPFSSTNSGVPDGDGGFLDQKEYVLQVNRKQNGGKTALTLRALRGPAQGRTAATRRARSWSSSKIRTASPSQCSMLTRARRFTTSFP